MESVLGQENTEHEAILMLRSIFVILPLKISQLEINLNLLKYLVCLILMIFFVS